MLHLLGNLVGFILIMILMVLILGMLFVSFVLRFNNMYHAQKRKEQKHDADGGKKVLLIYQPSKKQTSDKVAQSVTQGLYDAGCDVVSLYPNKHLTEDILAYDMIGFASPIYFGRPSKTIISTMQKIKKENLNGEEKTYFFYSVGGSIEAPEFDSIEESCGKDKIAYETKFVASDDKLEQKAYDFGFMIGKGDIDKEESL